MAGLVGKGHLETLVRLSRFLWGQRSLEGCLDDWCRVTGIQKHNFQRHVPLLGQCGGLRYRLPQRGYYVLLGFVQTETEVARLRQAWNKALHEGEDAQKDITHRVESLFLSDEATILSLPIVGVVSSSREKELKDLEQQQQAIASVSGAREATKLSLTPDEATKLSLPDEIREQLRTLGWAGSLDEIAQAYEQAPERVTGWLAYWITHKDDAFKSPAAAFRSSLRSGEEPPEVPEVLTPDEAYNRKQQAMLEAYPWIKS